MFDDDDYDELNLFYDDDNDNENGDWVNNYKEQEQEQEQQQSILPSQQDNNDNDADGVNNVNTVDDGVINLDDDDDDEPHIQPQYQRQHYIKKSNRNANTHIRSQRVGTLKHHNDNGGDNDSDCVIEIEKSEMTKHLEAKYENKCKIKMLTMDETKQLANERVKHKNDQAMIKEAKRKKYKTIPSNMSFNAFTGKFEQIKTAFDEAIEKEFEDSKYFIPQPQYTTTNTSNTKHNITSTTTISDTLQHQQQHKRNYNYNYNYKTHYNNNNKDETNSTSDKSSHCSQMKFLNKKHNNNNKHTATHSDYSFSDNEYKSNNNNNTNTVNRSYNNNHNHNHNHTHKQYIPKYNINNNNNPSCCTIDMTQLKYDIIKQIYTKDNHCRKDLMILFKQIKHYIHNRSTFNHHYTSLLHDHLSTPSHLDQLYSIGTFLYKTLCHHILSAAFPPKALSLTNNTMWRASDIPPIINDINTRTKP